jgi:hypothetical protein
LDYLPDDPFTHVIREYLNNIVNTLDPLFFRKAIDEVESARGNKHKQEPPKI